MKQIDICYKYDGSFYGMLCCVFESFEKKEMPIGIFDRGGSLFLVKNIKTDDIKAERVLKGVQDKMGIIGVEYVRLAYLASIKDKEIAIIHFIKEGLNKGKKFIEEIRTGFGPIKKMVAGSINNIFLAKIQKGIDLLLLEKQRFIQFVRFSEVYNRALVSIIEPEHQVLPLLADHFVQRFPNEQFLIYDKTHCLGLIYTNKEVRIERIEDYQMPDLSNEEKEYQELWKMFYDTIAIKERKNEKLRMGFMPKKYWENLTEMQ
ncbi:MAG: TIGR03915 family putative DNA repair protein [Firmicutes bacterium]|nr:TIGR03915 family putative DNA repair protein [Bacillota bacterium]